TLDHKEDKVFPAEEQPLPAAASPTAQSPDYVLESDAEDEPSKDDKDDDVDIEADDDEEEEEHSAPADSTAVALAAVDQAPSAEETKPFETDESAATPPPHPAYRIPSPPLPVSSPPPATPICSLGYRAAMIWLRAEAPSNSHSPPPHIILSHTRADTPLSGKPLLLPIPLLTSSPPLHLLSTDRRADRLKVTLPPRKRLGIALGPRYEVAESSSAPTARPPGGFRVDYGFVATIDREIMRDLERDLGYGITNTWDEISVDMPGAPTTDDTKLG
ncbi:hypothetical protein Tco_1137328, partial [Tanacetum coccineum]